MENNKAQGFGGGIHVYGNPTDKSQVVISGCIVRNNRAGRRGSGINTTKDKKCESTYLIEDCVVSDNRSLETGGGKAEIDMGEFEFKGAE